MKEIHTYSTLKEKLIKVLAIIKENPKGLLIADLTKLADYSRPTISKITAVLEAKGCVRVREIGRYKLHYWLKDLE